MTTASALAARRQFREGARDALANSDQPPGTGASSSVSPESLTTIAQGAGAAARQASAPGLSSDLQTSLNAATTPPLKPGQARGTDAGQRPQTTGQIDRGAGRDGR